MSQLIRKARHDAIDAMRSDLGLRGSARPPENFNAFLHTDLEQQYAKRHGLATSGEATAGQPDVIA